MVRRARIEADATAHPYRTLAAADERLAHAERDPVEMALGVAIACVIAWAVIRLTLASFRGFDVEGFVALVVVALAGERLIPARRRR